MITAIEDTTTKEYADAGFTHLALVQIGGEHQDAFLEEAAEPLLDKLRAGAP